MIGLSGCSVPAIPKQSSTTFPKRCDTNKSLRNTICPMTVVGGKQ